MNKNQKIALTIIIILAFVLGFTETFNLDIPLYKDSLKTAYPEVTSHSWKRDGGGDIETIYFTEEGDFGYYCSCGSPVDYYDLCDSYQYDQATNTIKLKCSPGVKVNKLKILEVSSTKLVLDFDGEKREFITEYSHLIDNPLPIAGDKFKTTGKEKIEIEFTKDGHFEAFNKTKEKYEFGSEICFNWEYDKDKEEISLDCQGETRKIKITKYNKGSEEYPTELELYFEHEDKTYYFTNKKDDK